MINNVDVIDYIEELLYIITDSSNNIIYPKNQNKVDVFYQIVKNKNLNDYIYDNNSNKWYKYHIKSFNNGQYKLEYLLDITEAKKDYEKKYQNDSLTSVLTRSTLLEKINQKLLECDENSYPFSIVIADIDHFKNINDSYGHIAGDEVLRNIGKIILENIDNNYDLVGRYGGEEFLFFFENINLENTINKITKIKNALDKLIITYQEKNISNITMSFGVYNINDIKNETISKQDMISELINGADIALYKSKQSGRNLTHVYSSEGFIKKVNYK